MHAYFVPALALGTSLLILVLGGALGLPLRRLPAALGKVLEALGLTLLFFAANLLIAAAVLLLGRLVAREFLPLYYANDVALLVCSALQALAFQWWREVATGRDPTKRR
ncbi:MAG: hypothetical protein ACE147_00105 [Candidatus Methylomirabilales bacterium]